MQAMTLEVVKDQDKNYIQRRHIVLNGKTFKAILQTEEKGKKVIDLKLNTSNEEC